MLMRNSLVAGLLLLQPLVLRAAPAIFFVDVETGPLTGGPNNLGVPISIFGANFGAERGSSKVTIGGVEVSAYPVWGSHNATNKALDMIVVQPGPNVKGGPIVVTVAGASSNANITFTPNKGSIRVISPKGGDNIQRTVERSSPGDTILLHGGTYEEREIWIRRDYGHSGAPGQPKTIKNYPGEEVTVTGRFLLSVDYVTVSGMRLSNRFEMGIGGIPIQQPPPKGDKLINNYGGGDIGYAFIDVHGNDAMLAGNVCEIRTSSQGTQGHCFYISASDNVKILYNVTSGAPGYGIHVFDEQRANDDPMRVIKNVLVEGNIVKNSSERSGMIVSIADPAKKGNHIENLVIRNNIFTANNHAGLIISSNIRSIKVYNNTFYQNGRTELFIDDSDPKMNLEVRNNLFFHSSNSNCRLNCGWYETAHVTFSKSGAGLGLSNNGYFGMPEPVVVLSGSSRNFGAPPSTSPIIGPVDFVNPQVFDFRLKDGAAAIDKGAALPAGSVPTDYNGVPRPQGAGVDLGAFEYVP